MKPICLLDIDGVLNPVPFFGPPSNDWAFEPSFKVGPFTMNFSKEMLDALQALPMEIQWLTTWCRYPSRIDVYEDLEPVLGLPRFKVHHELSDRRMYTHTWWKHDVVQKLLVEHPWNQRFVWIDDDLGDFHADTLDSDRVLTIRPDTDRGITKEHIELIRKFCEVK